MEMFLIRTAFILMTMSNQAQTHELITSDTTITRHIQPFEKFRLNFQSCPTCGFDWKIISFIDTSKLKIVDSATIQKHKNQTGGYTIKSWTFQGLSQAECQLIFIYKRPWLKEIEKKVIVNVKIE